MTGEEKGNGLAAGKGEGEVMGWRWSLRLRVSKPEATSSRRLVACQGAAQAERRGRGGRLALLAMPNKMNLKNKPAEK